MTKSELIAAISEKSGLTKAQAESAYNATFEVITEAMKKDKVMVQGFGAFSTKVREARKGRNPSSGLEMIIPRAIVVNFKPAAQLKETVNA